jgi:hypothetical protein
MHCVPDSRMCWLPHRSTESCNPMPANRRWVAGGHRRCTDAFPRRRGGRHFAGAGSGVRTHGSRSGRSCTPTGSRLTAIRARPMEREIGSAMIEEDTRHGFGNVPGGGEMIDPFLVELELRMRRGEARRYTEHRRLLDAAMRGPSRLPRPGCWLLCQLGRGFLWLGHHLLQYGHSRTVVLNGQLSGAPRPRNGEFII